MTSLRALQAIIRERSVMAGMMVFHRETGDVFQIGLPGFRPIVLVGPEASRFVLVTARDNFLWRMEDEPITNLLIHGVLVEDHESHDTIRRALNPALHKQMLGGYVDSMLRRTDQVTATWTDDTPVDMLVEMRKIALLILMDALFEVDYTPELQRLWDAVINLIDYISPGLWLVWGGAPRPGYRNARAQMDEYLFRIIDLRKRQITASPDVERRDMLSVLIQGGMADDLIRDQLMTMLIAGHDTSTALLAWVMHMFREHPDAFQRAQAEVDTVIADESITATNARDLTYLDQVVDETLRLFPPIHLGSRVAATDMAFNGYQISEGQRVLYSIFLTQRHPDYWDNPDTFNPDRFAPGVQRPHYTHIPFGGGPRNCIGMAFAQVEARVVLARILQTFDLQKRGGHVHLHMGATLEPRPGVMMQPVRR